MQILCFICVFLSFERCLRCCLHLGNEKMCHFFLKLTSFPVERFWIDGVGSCWLHCYYLKFCDAICKNQLKKNTIRFWNVWLLIYLFLFIESNANNLIRTNGESKIVSYNWIDLTWESKMDSVLLCKPTLAIGIMLISMQCDDIIFEAAGEEHKRVAYRCP